MKQQLSESVPVVGRFAAHDSVSAIVQDIRTELGLGDHPERGSWKDYYRDLINRIESLGVLVMRQGDLGHFSRPLASIGCGNKLADVKWD